MPNLKKPVAIYSLPGPSGNLFLYVPLNALKILSVDFDCLFFCSVRMMPHGPFNLLKHQGTFLNRAC